MERSIDELMWFIAEEGDHQAVDGFIKRYPEHRGEMIKRMNLVREVRGAKPGTGQPRKFHPREEVRQLASPRPRLIVGVGLAASIAAATWAGFAMVSSRQPEPVQSGRPVANRTEQPINPRLNPGYDPNQNVVAPPPEPPRAIPPYEKLVTLTSESISLMSVLDEISRQSGLRLQLAPDMPNPDVQAFYDKMPALAVLKDLGSRYGFSAFTQANDHVLLVPATDPNSPEPEEQPESHERQPREQQPEHTELPGVSESP
ncbi:MAG: hypothetical protein JNK63_01435 [Chthonomonas sp.]|nr:hypothetical protein [Chthonomonas sp.]